MDIRNIDIKFDEEDVSLILLCSLPMLLDNFVNSMLYGRDIISLPDVKFPLNFQELRTKLDVQGKDNQVDGLL